MQAHKKTKDNTLQPKMTRKTKVKHTYTAFDSQSDAIFKISYVLKDTKCDLIIEILQHYYICIRILLCYNYLN